MCLQTVEKSHQVPSFIADHLQYSSNQESFLLWRQNDESEGRHFQMLDYKSRVVKVLPWPFDLWRAKIVGSSNGLLCVTIFNEAPSLPSLLLWNPATREVRELPQPININGDFKAGFGFTPSVNDYKIVISSATQFFDDEHNRVEVFSLSTGSWKEIKVGNFGGVRLDYRRPVSVGGAMFWFGCKNGEGEEGHDWMIISFDLVTEVFALISLPTLLDLGSFDHLTVYENKLAILAVAVIEDDYSSVIDLWLMEEGRGASGERWGWSKIYTISTTSVVGPCCIWVDEIVCDVHLPECDEIALYLWNLNTREWENLGSCRYGCLSIIPNYVKSLVPFDNIHIEEP